MQPAEHYIPRTRAEVEHLTASQLAKEQRPAWGYFARLVCAWFHHAGHARVENQKEDLAALVEGASDVELTKRFADSLAATAKAANFHPISEAELNEALAEESTFRIRLAVDFSQFEQVVFYGRGKSQRTAQIARWFGYRTETVTFNNYESVLVFIRFNEAQTLDPELRGKLVLKLFANIPQADLEMLFPNSEIRMRLTDKLFIGVPAFVSGLIVLFTKLGSALLLAGGLLAFWFGFSDEEVRLDQAALIGLVTAAGALGGYLWKQFSNFKNKKIRFMKALTERLYFKNLDNYAGVLTALGNYVEESECKETLLAYNALLTHGAMDEETLRAKVEELLAPDPVHFDLADALAKLDSLGLTQKSADQITPMPLAEGVAAIDQRWDDLFSAEAL